MREVKNSGRSASTDKKIILAITLVYSAFFIYTIIKQYELLWFSIQDLGNSPIANISFLLPHIILPFGILFFWNRKPIGWILLTVFIVYTASVMMIELSYLVSWYYGSQEQDYLFLSESEPISDIIHLLLFIATLWIIIKTNIRRIYFITRPAMLITIFSSILLAAFLTILL